MRRFGYRAAAGLIATALLAAGCSSGSGGGTAPVKSSGGGAPQRGGTLVLLGQSDIFNLDPVSAYYTVSTLLERMFARQLVHLPGRADVPRRRSSSCRTWRRRSPRPPTAVSRPTARRTRSTCARALTGTPPRPAR